jgi:hypothetical protein
MVPAWRTVTLAKLVNDEVGRVWLSRCHGMALRGPGRLRPQTRIAGGLSLQHLRQLALPDTPRLGARLHAPADGANQFRPPRIAVDLRGSRGPGRMLRLKRPKRTRSVPAGVEKGGRGSCYLLFAGSHGSARGGLADLVQTFISEEVARSAFREVPNRRHARTGPGTAGLTSDSAQLGGLECQRGDASASPDTTRSAQAHLSSTRTCRRPRSHHRSRSRPTTPSGAPGPRDVAPGRLRGRFCP